MRDTILISDTHFGVRNNSMTWFDAQMKFFYDQFIPMMKRVKPVRIIHLGDVFDSRSTVNVAIAHKTHQLFQVLKSICPVYIIAGNHDYYSPNSDEINSIRLIFKDLEDKDFVIVDKDIEYVEDAALIPWYKWNREDLSAARTVREVKYWFAHTDLEHIEPEILPLLRSVQIYSGHIHTPSEIGENLHILGSCFALTFTDFNADRYFYAFNDGSLERIANKQSIRFWRIYDQDILEINDRDEYKSSDYFELYIQKELAQYDEYKEVMNKFLLNHRNSTVIVTTEETKEKKEVESGKSITDICQEMVPEHLQDKFMAVVESL